MPKTGPVDFDVPHSQTVVTLRDSKPQKSPFFKFTGEVTALEVWNPKIQRDLNQSWRRRQSSRGKGSGRKADSRQRRKKDTEKATEAQKGNLQKVRG